MLRRFQPQFQRPSIRNGRHAHPVGIPERSGKTGTLFFCAGFGMRPACAKDRAQHRATSATCWRLAENQPFPTECRRYRNCQN